MTPGFCTRQRQQVFDFSFFTVPRNVFRICQVKTLESGGLDSQHTFLRLRRQFFGNQCLRLSSRLRLDVAEVKATTRLRNFPSSPAA